MQPAHDLRGSSASSMVASLECPAVCEQLYREGPHRDLVQGNVGVRLPQGCCHAAGLSHRTGNKFYVCQIIVCRRQAGHSQGVDFDGGLGAAGQGALRALAGGAQTPQGTRVASDVLLVLPLELLQREESQQATCGWVAPMDPHWVID